MTFDLGSIDRWARAELDAKNTARERALRASRELIRCCANSIRAIHRRDGETARRLLDEAEVLHVELRSLQEGLADIYWTGYVQDAQKEFAEARCTLALIDGAELPDPTRLGIAPAPFLNGLAEAVGELRRYVLDMLRRGEMDGTERLLTAMDEIYGLLVTLDYPDALTGRVAPDDRQHARHPGKDAGRSHASAAAGGACRGAPTGRTARVAALTAPRGTIASGIRSRGVVAKHASLSRTRPPVRIRSGPPR